MNKTSSFDKKKKKMKVETEKWNLVIRSAGSALCLSDLQSKRVWLPGLVSSWFRKCSNPRLKNNFTPERKLTVVECEQCAYQTVTTHGRADYWLPRHFDIFPNLFF